MNYIIWTIIGLAGGVLGGMGMGGGTLLIPLLTMFGGLSQHAAQAVNLVAFVPMAIVALIIHFKNKLVEKKGLLPLIIAASLSGIGCSFAAMYIDAHVLKMIFGGFLALIGAVTLTIEIVGLVRLYKKKKESKDISER